MSRKPYLVVNDHEARDWKYRLSWYFPDDDDIGGSVGDEEYTAEQLTDPEVDRDCVVAYLAAKDTPDVARDCTGFYWETAAKANAALRVVKAALRSDGGAPMPDWAIKALAAGWKAPKGWKP